MGMDNRDSAQKDFASATDRFDAAKMLFHTYRPMPIREKAELLNVFSSLNDSFTYLSRAFDALAEGLADLSRSVSLSIGDIEDALEDFEDRLDRIEKAAAGKRRGPAGL